MSVRPCKEYKVHNFHYSPVNYEIILYFSVLHQLANDSLAVDSTLGLSYLLALPDVRMLLSQLITKYGLITIINTHV